MCLINRDKYLFLKDKFTLIGKQYFEHIVKSVIDILTEYLNFKINDQITLYKKFNKRLEIPSNKLYSMMVKDIFLPDEIDFVPRYYYELSFRRHVNEIDYMHNAIRMCH